MTRQKRYKKLINWTVQGPIILRLIWHLVICNAATVVVLLATLAMERSFSAGTGAAIETSVWPYLRPMGIALLVMLPVMSWELLTLTNRIVGPYYRYQKILQQFVSTGKNDHARIRTKDLTGGFHATFNEFVEAMHSLYPETKADGDRLSQQVKSSSGGGAEHTTATAEQSPYRV